MQPRFSNTIFISLPLVLALPLSTRGVEPEAPARASDGSPSLALRAQADRTRKEFLRRLGAGRWHVAGWTGRGIKIAILDTGFRDYRDHLGKALPEHVTVKSFRSDGNLEARNSQHGILCGEVIHTLAPDAE